MPRADPLRQGAQKWLLRACVALPLLMLGANLLAWLRWGTDLPYLDDWRVYDEGSALSLNVQRLFRAVNNTISPVGLALDVLAQRWLGGNPLPYQALSMVAVLGGLLWLQWRLLGWVVADRRQQALLFALCFPMLQSGSYWGEQNLAYHQALPLLALLAAVGWALRRPGRWAQAGVLALGLLAGLSYISGAIAAVVLGACWLVLGWVLHSRAAPALAARLRRTGGVLLLAGGLTSAMQIYLTRGDVQARDRQYMGLTSPVTSDFWAFLAAKIGRASGHGFTSLSLELAWVALLVLALVAALGVALRGLLARGGAHARLRRLAVVFVPLCAIVLTYLALVSLGRAGFRDPAIQDAGAVFRFGYERFHFFWATLLFPWVAAALALRVRSRGWATPALAGALLVLLALSSVRGMFDVSSFYRAASAYRAGEIRCLAGQLGSGQAIRCPGFDMMGMNDLTRAYVHARDINASFVRYLPILAREGFGRDLLRRDVAAGAEPGPWTHVRRLPDGWLQSEGDAQLTVVLPLAELARRCRIMGVQLELAVPGAETAQIYYRWSGEVADSETHSVRKGYQPDAAGLARLEFSLDAPAGFEPHLRIDPVDGLSRFRLRDLRVTCRLWGDR